MLNEFCGYILGHRRIYRSSALHHTYGHSSTPLFKTSTLPGREQLLYNSLPRQQHCRRREIAATFLDVALVIGYRYMLDITCYLGNIWESLLQWCCLGNNSSIPSWGMVLHIGVELTAWPPSWEEYTIMYSYIDSIFKFTYLSNMNSYCKYSCYGNSWHQFLRTVFFLER